MNCFKSVLITVLTLRGRSLIRCRFKKPSVILFVSSSPELTHKKSCKIFFSNVLSFFYPAQHVVLVLCMNTCIGSEYITFCVYVSLSLCCK